MCDFDKWLVSATQRHTRSPWFPMHYLFFKMGQILFHCTAAHYTLIHSLFTHPHANKGPSGAAPPLCESHSESEPHHAWGEGLLLVFPPAEERLAD